MNLFIKTRLKFLCLVLLGLCLKGITQSPSVLYAGTYMQAGQRIVSPDSVYACIFQGDGNLVVYKNMQTPIWSSNTVGQIITKCVLQFDGNFVLYAGDVAKWNSNSAGGCFPPYWIQMQGDGNLVIYNGKTVAIWSSMHGPTNAEQQMDCPIKGTKSIGAVLKVGIPMNPGEKLVSPNGIYSCVLQGDGNLVVYQYGQKVMWNSQTAGLHVTHCIMQNDGNFVLYDKNVARWNSETYGGKFPPYWIQMQGDGNLVIYNRNTKAIWSTMNGPTLIEKPPVGPKPPPRGIFEFQNICASNGVPYGWIKINDNWEPTSCGNPTTISYNVITIEHYAIIPVGLSINVCASEPTPNGWVVTGYTWNPEGCGHPITIVNNEKTIKHIN